VRALPYICVRRILELAVILLFGATGLQTRQAPFDAFPAGVPAHDDATRQNLASANSASSIPAYENSPSGLEALIQNMLSLYKRGDHAGLKPYLDSLVLPHPDKWFVSNFGDERCGVKQMGANDCLGPRFALSYASTARTLPRVAEKTLADLLAEGLTNFEAMNYVEPCASPQKIVAARKLTDEFTTTPFASPVVSKLVRDREPVYVLWAYSEKEETMIAFFVYSEGAFRYVGMIYPAGLDDFARSTAASGEKGKTPDKADNVAVSGDLTEEVVELHPVVVDEAKVKRTVMLRVTIGPDGKARDITYVRGPDAFKDAAIRSVEHRNFQPPSFAGRPVLMQTCISVLAGP
jgi:hypothetical protein